MHSPETLAPETLARTPALTADRCRPLLARGRRGAVVQDRSRARRRYSDALRRPRRGGSHGRARQLERHGGRRSCARAAARPVSAQHAPRHGGCVRRRREGARRGRRRDRVRPRFGRRAGDADLFLHAVHAFGAAGRAEPFSRALRGSRAGEPLLRAGASRHHPAVRPLSRIATSRWGAGAPRRRGHSSRTAVSQGRATSPRIRARLRRRRCARPRPGRSPP